MAQLEPYLAEKLVANPAIASELTIDPAYDAMLKAHGLGVERTLDPSEGPVETLELDKDWDLLNHLFTKGRRRAGLGALIGTNWPKAFLVEGGQPVGEGSGYGPDRLLSARQTAEVDTFLSEFDLAGALQSLTSQSIRRADIYSISQSDLPIEEIHRIARVLVEDLSAFVRRASTSGSSLFLYMT